MTSVSVQKAIKPEDRILRARDEADRLFENIQQRAFDLAAGRTSGGDSAFDDWLHAEREFGWPAAQLAERDEAYLLEVLLPGFDARDIEVMATARELIVKAKQTTERNEGAGDKRLWSELRRSEVCRRIGLPADIRIDEVKASVKDGMLSIVAPKAAAAAPEVPKKVAIASVA